MFSFTLLCFRLLQRVAQLETIFRAASSPVVIYKALRLWLSSTLFSSHPASTLLETVPVWLMTTKIQFRPGISSSAFLHPVILYE